MEEFENKNVDKLENNNENEWNFFKELIKFFKDLIVIIIIVLVIRTFLILPFQISGQSMYDSYYDKEFIIVDRFSYISKLKEPKRGDVIVFNTHIKNKEYFIKRIIGTPWETVKISWWMVYVKKVWDNDYTLLDEKYLSNDNYNSTYINWDDKEFLFTVPKWKYFVMWDNRNASSDSRTCFSTCNFEWSSNYINSKDIVWKVFIDLWYIDLAKFKFLHPNLAIPTTPKFFSSPSNYNYDK